MKYRTVVEREGEELGPVDWAHPMVKQCPIPEATLREIEAEPQSWMATNDGGWPRCGWKRVLNLAMYDGWPYWTPHPVFVVEGVLGVERWSFSSMSDVNRRAPVSPRPPPMPQESGGATGICERDASV